MMKVAIEGCCHGALDQIYSRIATLEKAGRYKVDLLLICGDFQAIRNHSDLLCMAVPQKYRELGGFHNVVFIFNVDLGGCCDIIGTIWDRRKPLC